MSTNANSSKVNNLLQNCLVSERTAYEFFHDMEHAFKRSRYKWLQRWFDKRALDSKCKKRKIINRIFALDLTPIGSIDTYVSASPDDPKAAFKTALALENGLRASYVALISAASSSTSYETENLARILLHETEKMIVKIEAQARQVDKLDVVTYLSTRNSGSGKLLKKKC